ncbi:hypothetical protein CPB83DRAFT_905922 [Crepidotus variabilis]|uniref:Uncharacterized protein n=1 Tax=Crepidotus variabilis TaxID=179855 RepID=A0A9P6JQS1_9AGAR|nr:hypothetical protein CPB83DRAFT_905922 [Crepidotus variabilis]
MPLSKSPKGSYKQSHLNPNRQPSSDSLSTGGVQQPSHPPLPSTNQPTNDAMSLPMFPGPPSPNTPYYPENSNLLQASSSTNNIGEAFMDLDDDDDPPPISRPSPQPLVQTGAHVPSPPHLPTSSSPPSKFSSNISSNASTNFHPSFSHPRQPNHPGLPSRSAPSFTTSGTRSRPVSYAPSEEVMLGLGLGSKINEMPFNLDKTHHLILYELPPSPHFQKRNPSKVSSFSGSMRGPMAYAYDPSADMNRPVDEEDRLHDPNARGYHDNSFPWRGVVNVAALVLMLIGMMALFLFYPIYTHYGDADRNERIQQIIDTNGMSKPFSIVHFPNGRYRLHPPPALIFRPTLYSMLPVSAPWILLILFNNSALVSYTTLFAHPIVIRFFAFLNAVDFRSVLSTAVAGDTSRIPPLEPVIDRNTGTPQP